MLQQGRRLESGRIESYGILLTLLAATLTVSPAFSQEKGKGKGKAAQEEKQTQIGGAGKQLEEPGSSQVKGKGKQRKEKKQAEQVETVKKPKHQAQVWAGLPGSYRPDWKNTKRDTAVVFHLAWKSNLKKKEICRPDCKTGETNRDCFKQKGARIIRKKPQTGSKRTPSQNPEH